MEMSNELKEGRRCGNVFVTEHEICKILYCSRTAILKYKRYLADPIPCYRTPKRFLYKINEVEKWAKRQADRGLKAFRERQAGKD